MIHVPFSYNRFFKENKHGSREEILRHIPSRIVLVALSYINHHLHLRKADIEIFNFISRNWEDHVRNGFIMLAEKSAKEHDSELIFFSKWITTEYIKEELLNYRDFEYQKPDTTPGDELLIFLSYLMFVDEVIDKQSLTPNITNATRGEWFEKVTWPILLPQFEFKTKQIPVLEAMKGNLLLTELGEIFSQEKYLKKYLSKYNFDSQWSFISSFVNIIKDSINKTDESNLPLIKISKDSPYRTLVESKTLILTEYTENQRLQVRYRGLKSKPLFKWDDDIFLVLSWDFLYSQMNLGVLFDFHLNSGVKEKFRSFVDFKSIISKEVSEKKLFRAILSNLFDKRHDGLHFDEEGLYPDAYARQGNVIYLFEFKDVLFPDDSIEESTYEAIKKVIDQKFIENDKGRPKGIKQIRNYLSNFSENHYPFDDFEFKGIKRRNLTVCPIMVFDNLQFTFPGVNSYLNRRFDEFKKPTEFKYILPVTLISLDYLFRNTVRYRRYKLVDGLKQYHQKIKRLQQKLDKDSDPNKLGPAFSAIEFTPFKIAEIKLEDDAEISERILSFMDKVNVPKSSK